ncbi:MAG TPA: YdaS family helix-turn-helix protein [Noviherbaspirillum sp.]|nr:YdaS family helix-turn-helix protein [Noviherbaspirillum sp.]
MKLRDYLNAERGRQASLCRAIGAYPSDMSRWADGTRPIPIPYGPLIEDATGGEVSRKDLFPEEWKVLWPEISHVANECAVDRRKSSGRRSTDKGKS